MSQDNFKTIGEYFSLNKPFVVPYYQRGYKWSLQKNEDKNKTHFKVLLGDLEAELIKDSDEYYLQGVTVKEKEDCIELVDGQQRTTSLFILLCALKTSNVTLRFQGKEIELTNKLSYKVRARANEVLQKFTRGETDEDNTIQDIAALNRAFKESQAFIASLKERKEDFARHLLENVKLIYINLDVNQNELDTFSIMNQDKAVMTKTDLVKSNLLRETSRQVFSSYKDKDEGLEWQINHLRTKLATEWDEWRKWWKNDSHFDFVGKIKVKREKDVEEPELSGLLAIYYHYLKGGNDIIKQSSLFEEYKEMTSDVNEGRIEAIEVFEGLRRLQKSIEEWFEDFEIYNYYNLLNIGTGTDKSLHELIALLKEYQNNKKGFKQHLKSLYIKRVIDYNESSDMSFDVAKRSFVSEFNDATDVYHHSVYYYQLVQQLLRMNVMRVNKQKMKFDFSLYAPDYKTDIDANSKTKSLEHIAPQSHGEVEALAASEETISSISHIIRTLKDSAQSDDILESVRTAFTVKDEAEPLLHSIGNFVLLPQGLNSSLSNKPFAEKKQTLFNKMVHKADAKNYGLWLHTLEVFGKNVKWGRAEIKENKACFLKELMEFLEIKQ